MLPNDPVGYAPTSPIPVSWRAVSVPSFLTPAFTFILCAGRLPTHRNVSSRLRNSFTGRCVIRASCAAITVYLLKASFAPKPPPM